MSKKGGPKDRVAALASSASTLSLGSDAGSEASTPRSDSGTTLTAAGEGAGPALSMKEKAALRKAAKAAAKGDAKAATGAGADASAAALAAGVQARGGLAAAAAANLTEAQLLNAAARTATGVLATEKRSRDIKIDSFSLSLHSNILIEDTTLELNYGQRYGLIGRNGSGKSTLLQCLAAREVPIPEHIDIYLLSEEAEPSEMTALEYVIESAKKEVARLEALGEALLAEQGPDSEMLMDVYDRQTELDPTTFETRASTILIGLGFDRKTIHKRTKDMSGGWRMRVALARALFVKPALLLLDEPTNHLDLGACVWLEDYLAGMNNCCILLISHSQDFLNGVCTRTMVLEQKKLRSWGGSYDTYVKTRAEQDAALQIEYDKQQLFIKDTKAFIASCGTFANLVRQAKSRQKILDKMVEEGLVKPPYKEPVFKFKFPETAKLPPPLISVSNAAFSYSGKKEDYLYTGLNFGIDSDSRIALVGPNGAGKSTLIKMLVGENRPCEGGVSSRPGIIISRYNQHSAEVLDLEATPVEYIERKFKDRLGDKQMEQWRSVVGSFGIPSNHHLKPIKTMSGGLKHRLVLAELALQNPHILLFDEPTNASDLEGVDSLAEAINAYKGAVVVVSHDFRLLSQIIKPENGGQIWLVDHGITVWPGDIISYKKHLRKEMASQGGKL